jgi:hypothetical protein
MNARVNKELSETIWHVFFIKTEVASCSFLTFLHLIDSIIWYTACHPRTYLLHVFGVIVILEITGFGGLEVACWPLVPKFAGSHRAEAVGFLGPKKNPSARLPSEGK